MRAIGKYIAIKPIKEVNTKTKGGLILAESQREDVRYRQAEVVVVGGEVKGFIAIYLPIALMLSRY